MSKAEIKALFHQRVLHAYETYRDIREASVTGMNRLKSAAFDLATAIHHFPEILPAGLGWPAIDQTAELVFVSELSNVSKHGVRQRGQQVYLSRFDAVSEIAITTEYDDDDGSYTDTGVRVIASCLDGKRRDVDPFLIGSLNQWIDYLSRLDVTPSLTLVSPAFPGSAFVARAQSRKCAFEANRQTDFTPVLQLQRFDPVSSTSHALDLEGADIQFRMYAPPTRELVLTLTSGDGKHAVEAAVALTHVEATDLEAAEELGLGEAMMAKIAERRRAEFEAALAEEIAKLDVNATRT